jgi:hypothetical protein
MQLTLIIIAVIIYLAVLTYYLAKTVRHYRELVRISGKVNLGEILEVIIDRLKIESENQKKLREELEEMKKESRLYVQKVGLHRYNPFRDIGGEHSFILALLDKKNDGIVLTSLHSRGNTRWYIKKVTDAKGLDFDLSKEEIKAIENAKYIKEKNEK